MADRIGQQLGDYRLIRLIGKGALAEVYLGEHAQEGTQAAVKVFHKRLEGEDAERFQEEALRVARLNHPHIARIFGYAVEEGVPFLAMDYAPNGALRSRFPRGDPQAPGAILPYVWQVADALHYAHGQHLVHRDVRPENMLLDARNEVLLSDFGIGAALQSSSYQMAQEIVGTATYMAPEQIEGQARPASDQYALAAIIYEWLCGVPPFEGSAKEVMAKHLFTEPLSLHGRVRTISPAIEAVIMGALSKDPADRFPSAQSFAAAFDEACQAVPVLLFMAPRVIEPPEPEDEELAESTQTMSAMQAAPDEPDAPAVLDVPAAPVLPIILAPPPSSAVSPSANPARWPMNPEPIVVTPKPSFSGPGAPPAGEPPPPFDKVTRGASWREVNWMPPATRDPAPLFQPLEEPRPLISRRTILIGGVAGLTVIAGALTWMQISQPRGAAPGSVGPATTNTPRVTPKPARTPTPKPASLGTTLFTYHGHSGFLRGVSWSPDGKRIASASDDHTAQVWDAFSGEQPLTYKGHSREVMAVAWSPSGKLIASGGKDQTLKVWDAITGKTLHSFDFGHWVMALAWSPDGKHLAAGSWDYTVQVWNTTTWKRVHNLNAPGWVNALAWSSDNIHLVSGDGAKVAVVWNISTGGKILTYRRHTAAVLAVAWAPVGNQIASGADLPDTTVQYWNRLNGARLWSAKMETPATSLAWSPDGKRLAAGGGSASLLNPATGAQLFTYQGDGSALAWSPDGKYIASGGQPTTVQVWQAI